MTTAESVARPEQTVELAPSYRIPLALIAIALPIIFWQPFVGGAIELFGLFLLFQTVSLRLRFTPVTLEVYRGEKQIRDFPYSDWQNWEIFWNRVPILFYFKEVKSIHFLPIIFDAQQLRACLEQRCPR